MDILLIKQTPFHCSGKHLETLQSVQKGNLYTHIYHILTAELDEQKQ